MGDGWRWSRPARSAAKTTPSTSASPQAVGVVKNRQFFPGGWRAELKIRERSCVVVGRACGKRYGGSESETREQRRAYCDAKCRENPQFSISQCADLEGVDNRDVF